MQTLALLIVAFSLIARSRKIIIINLCALFALSASAAASIGQTMQEVELDARRSPHVVEIQGPTAGADIIAIVVTYRDGSTIAHIFSEEGRGFAVGVVYTPTEPIDIHKEQQRSGLTWKRLAVDMWEADTGLNMTLVRKPGEKNELWLFVPKEYIVWPPGDKPGTRLVFGPHARPKPVPTPAPDIDFSDIGGKRVPETPAPDRKDCLIVATETLARLKHTAYWARIVGFEYGSATLGHAVVLFQPSANSNVWLYDAAGSRQLRTHSHELGDLRKAINEILPAHEQLSEMQWVD